MKKIIAAVISIIVLFTAGYFFWSAKFNHERPKVRRPPAIINQKLTPAQRKVRWALLEKNVNLKIGHFKGVVGLVIQDLDTHWEIDHDKDVRIPSASIVKIPIMLACYYAVADGKLDLQSQIHIGRFAKTPGSGLLKNAPKDSTFSVEDLIYLMITQSDNTAANILIDLVGPEALNKYFLKMGLKSTNLSRKMMDFSARKEGVENYTTAGDIAYLLRKLYDGRFINRAASEQCLDLLSRQKINDRIPKKLPNDTPVAHKTGLESGLCHDAGIVYTKNGNFLICVLVKHNYRGAGPAKWLISRISLLVYNYYNNF